jgi:hypothetical protein
VARDDVGVTFDFFVHQIILGLGRKWGVVQHLHDVKSSQPNIEASCGFEPPMGHKGARLASPLEVINKPCFHFPKSFRSACGGQLAHPSHFPLKHENH